QDRLRRAGPGAERPSLLKQHPGFFHDREALACTRVAPSDPVAKYRHPAIASPYLDVNRVEHLGCPGPDHEGEAHRGDGDHQAEAASSRGQDHEGCADGETEDTA